MFYWIYMYVRNTLDEAFSHDSMKSKVCWHGGVAQHLILFLAAGGRDDWGCEEIINLHIESGFHNQTNSKSRSQSREPEKQKRIFLQDS